MRRRALPLLLSLAAAPAVRPALADEPLAASVAIDAGRVEAEVSRLLYGHFLEFMYEGIKFGFDAELLRDRGFEEPAGPGGLPPGWERDPDSRNDDYALKLAVDGAVAYPPPTRDRPGHALRVAIAADDGVRRGIRQAAIPVRSGVEYRGSLWLRGKDFRGQVVVALEADRTGGSRLAAAELAVRGDGWRRHGFVLRPGKADPLAKLVVLFRGKGTLWIDQISLRPGDEVGGVRADVLAKIRPLAPAFFRWPGGNVAQDYHWMWGVGPRDQRFAWRNTAWGNELEPSDFGTDEYLAFCRRLGATPTLTVNLEGAGATAAEAAAWVEYVNGAATSRHGRLRAKNGRAAPYRVVWWEVGNEIWGDWVRGHSDARTYADNLVRYVRAMKKVDPSIKIIAVGDNDMKWNQTVLSIAGKSIDVLAVHHYYGSNDIGGDRDNLLARPLFFERFYRDVDALARRLTGRRVPLAINEWGVLTPERWYSLEAALYGARLMNVFERSSEIVHMSAVSDLVNGWPGGIIQASRHGLFVTPTWHAVRMWATHRGAVRVAAAVKSPTHDTSKEGKGVPWLDAVATRAARGGGAIYLKLVNTHPSRPLRTQVTVKGAAPRARARLETLTGPSLDTVVDWEHPDAVSVSEREVAAGPSFTVELPARSASVLTIDTAPARR